MDRAPSPKADKQGCSSSINEASSGTTDYMTASGWHQCYQCVGNQCHKVSFNVSGYVFETQKRTLKRYPGTLLGSPSKLRQYWDPDRKQYCLNRHQGTFQCMLYYYQSGGRLYRADEIPEDVFITELDYYELDRAVVSAFKLRNGFMPERQQRRPAGKIKKKIWLALEYPSTSWPAVGFAIFSLLITCVSLLIFCIESIPQFDEVVCVRQYTTVPSSNNTIFMSETQHYLGPLFLVECSCIAWFIIEACLRFFICESKLTYFRSVTNIFDVLAILPFFVVFAIVLTINVCNHAKTESPVFIALRISRLLRSARVFKLTKHSRGMHILGLTILHSLKELWLFVVYIAITVTLFASIVYYADELDTESENIKSIPEAYWYVIVTYCTVGYGDIVPTGLFGKLVGTSCAICGVITIGLLVPVVVENFSRFYNHELVERTRNK